MGDTPSPGDAAGSYYTLLRQAPRTHQAFIALACMQCVCIVLERVWLFVLTPMSAEAQQREAVWFLTVILISVCFVLYFAVHGVLQTNAFEMIAFLLASLFLLLRLALEFATNSEECGVASNRDLCLAFIVLASAFVVTAMAFSVKLYRDLQWKRYKALGAAVDTRRMYRYFEAFSALRKLDVQFSLVTLVTGVAFFVGTSKDLGPFATPLSWACLVLFAVELLWERLGDYGVKRESARALAGFWALSGLLPAFIVVVAVESASSNRLLALAVDNSVRWIIAIMAAIALANRIATVAATVVLYRNFGPPYVALRRIIEGDRKEAFSRSRFNRLGRRDAAAPGEGVAGGAGGSEGAAAQKGGAGSAISLARVEALAAVAGGGDSTRAGAGAAVGTLGGARRGGGGAVVSTNPLAALDPPTEGAAPEPPGVPEWR